MDNLTNDLINISISIVSTFIANFALIISRNTSKRASKIESSNIMAEIHEKISESRRIMQDIYLVWQKERNFKLNPSELIMNENIDAKKDFITYYNNNFHKLPSGTQERIKSNQIHSYLHEIHHLWIRYENKEFDLEEIMQRFHVAISMDKYLLLLYLEAHWCEHGEMEKEKNNRFWNKVPIFIHEVEKLKE